ncbi:asparagine synthase (glutamine-hydrolyzing) [Opitutales bacterium]|nr:asparagine synthase (glutamine-hydrolyzing) [Opitutales bacterium]
MCGIAGFFCKNNMPEKRIDQTLKLMKNRGPDHQDAQVFINHSSSKTVGLLHSRLSIIDLDPRSNQPFTIGNLSIVYNGEIYNFVELREKLEKKNIFFSTQSDTEVLLHYFRLYGEKCVDYFEGMWAFAIYNHIDGSLFLSRDRFSEKPLYYMKNGHGFFFGSETKFLKSLSGTALSVNKEHLMRHLAHGYKSLYKTDQTYFIGVSELKFAQNIWVSSKGVSKPYRYWLPTSEVDNTLSLEDSISGARESLLESVRIRLRADVPLAFCLSGGVDSAAIVSIAAKEFNAKVTTFSIIDSDERYNEKDNIMATVEDLGCDHHLISASQQNPLERLEKLIQYHDAPIATISYYVHSMISESIHKGGYRVSFSGTSADELFTGYYDHFILHLNEMRDSDDYPKYLEDWSNHIGKFVRNPDLSNPNLYFENPNFRKHVFDASDELKGFFIHPFEEKYTEETYSKNLMRNRMLNELLHEATPLILHEDDLNSMLYSVENRSPYLDTRLQKFAYSIPSRHLIKNGYGKYVLRKATEGLLNDQVRLDRRKKGFNASINSIIDLHDPDVQDYILDDRNELFTFINREKVRTLLLKENHPNHFSKFIFNLLNTKIFLEKN